MVKVTICSPPFGSIFFFELFRASNKEVLPGAVLPSLTTQHFIATFIQLGCTSSITRHRESGLDMENLNWNMYQHENHKCLNQFHVGNYSRSHLLVHMGNCGSMIFFEVLCNRYFFGYTMCSLSIRIMPNIPCENGFSPCVPPTGLWLSFDYRNLSRVSEQLISEPFI